MIRQASFLIAAVVCGLTGSISSAQPVVVGNLNGVELCTQDLCGRALFLGSFVGTVDGRFAIGSWSTTANHGDNPPQDLDPLPEADGEQTNMVGAWNLRVYVLRGFRFRRESFGGGLAGTLTNRGDNDRPIDNFDLRALAEDDATGALLAVDGILRHDQFPPRVNLTIGPAQ